MRRSCPLEVFVHSLGQLQTGPNLYHIPTFQQRHKGQTDRLILDKSVLPGNGFTEVREVDDATGAKIATAKDLENTLCLSTHCRLPTLSAPRSVTISLTIQSHQAGYRAQAAVLI